MYAVGSCLMSNLSFVYQSLEGWVEEVVSKDEAVERQSTIAAKHNHFYANSQEAYDDFMSINLCSLTDKPVGKYYEK